MQKNNKNNHKNIKVFNSFNSPIGEIHIVVEHLERNKPLVRIEKIERRR